MKKAGGNTLSPRGASSLPVVPTPKRSEAEERKSEQDRLSSGTPPSSTQEKIQRVLKKDVSSPKPPSNPANANDKEIPTITPASQASARPAGKALITEDDYEYEPPESKIKFKTPSGTADPKNSPTSRGPRKREITAEHQEVIDEIAAFEKTLKNFDLDDPNKPQTTKADEKFEMATFIKKIRERKQMDVLAKQEREKRRRRALVEQQQAQKEMENKKRDQMLLKKLMKQSQEERALTASILEIREQKEKMRQNRIVREQLYAEKRRKEFEDALERDAHLARRNRDEYEKQVQLEKQKFKELEEQREKAKHDKHVAVCTRIVKELIDLTFKVAEYRIITDGENPGKEFTEWKTLFIKGRPLFPKKEAPQIPQEQEVLNEAELKSYLEAGGEWKVVPLPDPQPSELSTTPDKEPVEAAAPAEEPKNHLLGKIVEEVLQISTPEAPPAEKMLIPDFPIKVCIIGKTFSGKSTQAKMLATFLNRVEIISPESVIEDAINSLHPQPTEQRPQSQENASRPLTSEVKSLAEQAQRALKTGKVIDDKVIVGLLVERIRSIESANNSNGGWILDGFPRTAAQAELFEKEISGYEHPSKSKKKKAKRSSRIAVPPPKVEVVEQPKSGMDMVVYLDLDDETSMRRSVGRRVDPKTGSTYHLEFNPPPTDQQLVNERLTPMDGTSSVYHQLATFNESKKDLEEWFKPFLILRTLNANQEPGHISQILNNWCTEILNAKAREAERKKEEEEKLRLQMEAEMAAKREREERAKEEARRLEEQRLLELQQKKEEEKKPRRRRDRNASANNGAAPQQATAPVATAAPPAAEPTNSDKEKAAVPDDKTAGVQPAAATDENTNKDGTAPAEDTNVPPKEKLSLESATMLNEKWKKVEEQYIDGMKRTFQAIREEKQTITARNAQVRTDFVTFLNRPDTFQEKIEGFKSSVSDLVNKDEAEIKNEIHHRAEELKETLWQISDKRKAEAEEEKNKIIKDSWLESHFTLLLNNYIKLMQLEVDRHVESKQMIHDYHRTIHGEPLEVIFRTVDLPSVGSAVKVRPPSVPPQSTPLKKKKKAPPKTKKEDEPFADLLLAVDKALSLTQKEPEPPSSKKKEAQVEPPPPVNEEMEQALKLEDDILKRRIVRIKSKAISSLNELKAQADRMFLRLDEVMGQRYRNEIANIENLVKDFIEKEWQLSSMQLQNCDVQLDDEGAEGEKSHQENKESEETSDEKSGSPSTATRAKRKVTKMDSKTAVVAKKSEPVKTTSPARKRSSKATTN